MEPFKRRREKSKATVAVSLLVGAVAIVSGCAGSNSQSSEKVITATTTTKPNLPTTPEQPNRQNESTNVFIGYLSCGEGLDYSIELPPPPANGLIAEHTKDGSQIDLNSVSSFKLDKWDLKILRDPTSQDHQSVKEKALTFEQEPLCRLVTKVPARSDSYSEY